MVCSHELPSPFFLCAPKSCGVWFQAACANHSRSCLQSCQLRCAWAGAPNPAKIQQPDFNTLWGPLHPFLLPDLGRWLFMVKWLLCFLHMGQVRGSLCPREKNQTSWGGSIKCKGPLSLLSRWSARHSPQLHGAPTKATLTIHARVLLEH